MKQNNFNGWVSLHRKIQAHWLHPKVQERKFTEYEAWIDLFMTASHREYKHVINEQLITIPEGCIAITVQSLSNRWKWCREKTAKFLKLLEKEEMITCNKINPKSRKSVTLAKINNYMTYQDKNYREQSLNQTLDSKSEPQTDVKLEQSHNNNINKNNNFNKENFKNSKDIYLTSLKEVV